MFADIFWNKKRQRRREERGVTGDFPVDNHGVVDGGWSDITSEANVDRKQCKGVVDCIDTGCGSCQYDCSDAASVFP